MADKNSAKIKFSAETGEFTAGIKTMNSDISKLTAELKLNAAQMKAGGDQIDLLKQRQGLLSTELDKSREKVELTSQKLEVAKGLYGDNSTEVQNLEKQLVNAKTQEANISAEIAKTNKQLEQQEETVRKANDKLLKFSDGMQGAGKKISNFGTGLQDTGKNLAPVTAAVAGMGAASMAAWSQMDDGYDTIITKTGATGDALADLQGTMDNVFTSIPTDASTAGTAVGEVNTRFKETGKNLEDLSTKFIQFANINETDVNTSIDNTSSIMKKFNVDTSDAGSVLGLMTKVGQDTGLSMDTLQGSLMTNGATLKEMGLGITESVNLLGQFESTGVDASTAMAGLKKAQQNATKEGKTLGESLGDTVTKIKNASSETDALQIATDLFGKKGAAEMTQAIREGKFSVDNLSASLSDYSGVVTDTFNATLDPPDKAKVALNQLTVAGSQLASTGMTALTPMLTTVTDKVKEFTTWFAGLNTKQQETILKVALLVAGLAPMLIIIGKVATGIGALTSLIGTVTGAMAAMRTAQAASTVATEAATLAQTGLNVAFLANPITWIVLGIAALVAAFVVLWNKSEAFRNFWIGLWDGLKGAVGTAGGWIEDGIDGIGSKFKSMKDTAASNFSALKGIASKELSSLKNTFEQNGGGVKGAAAVYVKGINDAFKTGYDAINTMTGGKLDIMRDKVTAGMQKAHDVIKNIVNKIKSIFNFKFEWPHVKVPSLSVSWSADGVLATAAKLLGLQGMPHFNVTWNASGAILNKPAIVGYAGGSFQGAGEAGPEAILPISKMEDYIGNKMAEFIDLIPTFDYDKMAEAVAIGSSASTTSIVLNERELGRVYRKVK